MTPARENYGIDAPTVVRNLAFGGAALIVFGLAVGRLVPQLATVGPNFAVSGVWMSAAAFWMLASSLWLKKRVMKKLLGQREWSGREKVLDVGSGRGLVAVEAARRTPGGSVHAIDLWQQVDLSDNSADNLRANAAAAGVRVTVDTGDARALPYADGAFDVVTSMTVIHNIPDAAGRAKAVAEIWRVVKPGGQVMIFDIRHARGYLKQLRSLGAMDVKLHGPILLWGPMGWRFSVRKPG